MSLELAIILPTYNEAHNIEVLLERLRNLLSSIEYEIIIIDDDSPDGTAARVREHARAHQNIHCIQRLGRRGLSSACVEGILATAAPVIAIMDADLQHDETVLPKMFSELKDGACDLVIASRYVESGDAGGLSEKRKAVSQLGTRLAQYFLRQKVTDPLSGFFMFRREMFQEALYSVSGKGFKILLDLLLAVQDTRTITIKELPFSFRPRQEGASKLNLFIVSEFFLVFLDRLMGRIIPIRFLMFVCVGVAGALIHLLVLGLCFKFLYMPFIFSQFCAALNAMVINFILNNVFTYRDLQLTGMRFVKGLISFSIICSLGAFANVLIAQFLYELSLPWWLAGGVGAIFGAVWNYAVSATFTWSKPKLKN